jgi:glutamate-1-semialdehyde 2,1-aminomutase
MTPTALAREIERYVAKTPRPRALQAEAERVLPGGSSRGTAYFAPYPFFADHGDGHHVYDVDGNRYLDFMLNATTLIAGHASPLVVEALGEQAASGAFVGTFSDAVLLTIP